MAVIKDVAELAGVSISTVSKYFNNPSGLKETYRERVKEAVEKLNYTPDPMARSLRTKLTNTLALVVPDITNSFYVEVYNEVRTAAILRGYTTQLYTTEENVNILSDLLQMLSPTKIDGIILCFLDEDEIQSTLSKTESSIPTTLMTWNVNSKYNSVVLNLDSTIYHAAKYLIENGRKKIAYVNGISNSRISKEKLSGYLRAMREFGFSIRDDYLYDGKHLFRTGFQAAKQFMALSDPPDAIVAANDILAIGCCKYLLSHDYRVPQDVAVTGMDGIPLSRIYDPSITTMASPIKDMCSTAVDILLENVKNPNIRNSQFIYDTKLVVGRSTDEDVPLFLDY